MTDLITALEQVKWALDTTDFVSVRLALRGIIER